MTCPHCIREGKKSMVFPANNLGVTIPFTPFLDTDGVLVAGSPIVKMYGCTEGHSFSLKEMNDSTITI